MCKENNIKKLLTKKSSLKEDNKVKNYDKRKKLLNQ